MATGNTQTGIRLAELLAVLSLGADLGLNQPIEHVMRQSLIALRIGERLGLDDAQRAVLYYSSLIAWVGCQLDPEQPFDVVTTFDTIHDLVDPVGVLACVHASLRPGGTYLMVEPHVSSNLEDNMANPMAALVYSVSTLHCLTVSLAEGGAGLGTAFGEQKAFELLSDAGFVDAAVHPHPADPMDGIFVSRKPEEA